MNIFPLNHKTIVVVCLLFLVKIIISVRQFVALTLSYKVRVMPSTVLFAQIAITHEYTTIALQLIHFLREQDCSYYICKFIFLTNIRNQTSTHQNRPTESEKTKGPHKRKCRIKLKPTLFSLTNKRDIPKVAGQVL